MAGWMSVVDTIGKGVGNMVDRYGNKKQLKAEQDGLRSQVDYLNDQYGKMGDNYSQAMSPYMQSGQTATDNLGNAQTQGTNYSTGENAFIMPDYTESDSYKFRMNQGVDALDQSAVGDGSLFSGGQQKELMEYGQGLASDEYDKLYNREMSAYQDNRGYNTALDANNMNRDIANNQFLSSQGYDANKSNASTQLGITDAQTGSMMDNLSQQIGNKSSQIGNKYGFISDQNKIAGDGFNNFFGGFASNSFGG